METKSSFIFWNTQGKKYFLEMVMKIRRAFRITRESCPNDFWISPIGENTQAHNLQMNVLHSTKISLNHRTYLIQKKSFFNIAKKFDGSMNKFGVNPFDTGSFFCHQLNEGIQLELNVRGNRKRKKESNFHRSALRSLSRAVHATISLNSSRSRP